MDTLGFKQLNELVIAYAHVNTDSALHYYTALEQLSSKEDLNSFTKGIIYYNSANYDSAHHYFQKTIDINEYHPKATYFDGKTYLEEGNIEQVHEHITTLKTKAQRFNATKLQHQLDNYTNSK